MKHVPKIDLPAEDGSLPDGWLVVGVDPSLSRTGYAILSVDFAGEHSNSKWCEIGSVKPKDASQDAWIRQYSLSTAVKDMVENLLDCCSSVGLLLVFEYPTPRMDALVALNRVMHTQMLTGVSPLQNKANTLKIMHINASTLRKAMALTQKGTSNKTENIQRAYDFVDQDKFPMVDSDACDAILLAMMGRHGLCMVKGMQSEVPESIQTILCDTSMKQKKVRGKIQTVPMGIMHQQVYWYTFDTENSVLSLRDASKNSKRLDSITITI